MNVQTTRETLVSVGQIYITKYAKEIVKATRVATGIVVVVYDTEAKMGGMAHMALPDSKMSYTTGDAPEKYVDLAIPLFIKELTEKGLIKNAAHFKIIGGSQLFNFGGGSGNILNIGTRNAITARTMLTREGIQVEKTETGGNKPRTVILDMTCGQIKVFHPGETPRII